MDEETIQDIRERVERWREVRKGYTYQKPPYDGPCKLGEGCPICGGTGFYRVDVEVWDPRFGKAQRCPNTDITRFRWFSRLGLREKELQMTWDHILPVRDGMALQAADAVRRYMSEREGGWVYLYGSHGVAKSLILKIVVAEAFRRHGGLETPRAAYANMTRILEDLKAAYDEKNPSAQAQERLEFWSDIPVLCIDEIDLIHGTEWAENRRFQMMDSRYTGGILGESFTLISSNKRPEELGSWLADRISDGRFLKIPMYGESSRPEMTDLDRF